MRASLPAAAVSGRQSPDGRVGWGRTATSAALQVRVDGAADDASAGSGVAATSRRARRSASNERSNSLAIGLRSCLSPLASH